MFLWEIYRPLDFSTKVWKIPRIVSASWNWELTTVSWRFRPDDHPKKKMMFNKTLKRIDGSLINLHINLGQASLIGQVEKCNDRHPNVDIYMYVYIYIYICTYKYIYIYWLKNIQQPISQVSRSYPFHRLLVKPFCEGWSPQNHLRQVAPACCDAASVSEDESQGLDFDAAGAIGFWEDMHETKGKLYFTSCDPHHDISRCIFVHIFYIFSDNLSDRYSDILSAYILASYLTYVLAFCLAVYLTYILTFYLAFYLTYVLTCYLAFYLTYILTFYVAFYLTYILTFYLTFYVAFFHLAFYLAFYLAYILQFYLAFYLAVEVQQCALGSGGPRLRHWAREVPGWGPVAPTGSGSWRGGEEEKEEEKLRRAMLKSNNPNLAGGELKVSRQMFPSNSECWWAVGISKYWA